MSQLKPILIELLATLRAIRWHSHVTHWKAAGPGAYSDHLLFQRIYAGDGGGPNIDDQIDGLGERIVALFGSGAIDGVKIQQRAVRIHKMIRGVSLVAGALQLEEHALRAAGRATLLLKTGPAALRVSLDNFVRELADARSTVVYLLKQRLKGSAGGDYGGLPLSTVGAIAGGGALLGGLLLIGPFVITPFILKAFVPKWSYGRRVVAGFGISAGVGIVSRLIQEARAPEKEAASNPQLQLGGPIYDDDQDGSFNWKPWAVIAMGAGIVGYLNYNSPWGKRRRGEIE